MVTPPKSDWTFPAIARMQAEKHGDSLLCSFDDGKTLSFRSYDRLSDSLASALAGLGVGPGDRVVGMLRNGREFLLAMLATHKRGAIYVPINVELKGSFLEHQIRNTEPTVVIVEGSLRPAFDGVKLDGIPISSTISVDGAEALPGTKLVGFDAICKTAPRAEDVVPVTPYDVAMIIFTSGTTGPAKGVLMPHAHCFFYALAAARATRLQESDRMFISMPMFHGTALLLQFYSALLVGIPSFVVKRFSASTWLDEIRACGATVTYAVGVMPEFIFKQPERPDDADNPLRLSWSVPVADSWGAAFEKRFGMRILQGYGMTEFSVPVWGDLADPVRAGCAGRVMDDFFEIRIIDPETDEAVPQGQIGEIAVRPKEPGVFMAGYYRMPDKTIEAWRNLWFHSGDAGYFDEAGRLFYVDRIKDRMRRRGENISAFEIEEVINSHPDVEQCAVVGVRTEDSGGEDEIMAFVVCKASADARTLLDWCEPRMPRFALPRFVEFVPDIERTASGKIRKQALRDRGVGPKTFDRGSGRARPK
jgi:crotonobetaine/carnitine-CoA ligase